MAEEFKSGLEGVVAFQTEIAEPDKEGGSLRYRGVDIEDLVGQVPFEKVWGLLVDGSFDPGMPPATPYPLPARSGDTRVDVQAALAQLAPAWASGPCSTSRTKRRVTTWPDRRSWRSASLPSLPAAVADRPCRRPISTAPPASPSGSCCAGAARP